MFTSGNDRNAQKGSQETTAGSINSKRIYTAARIRNEDILMSVLTLGHANAQVMGLFSAIGAGASVVFYPRFSASKLLEMGL